MQCVHNHSICNENTVCSNPLQKVSTLNQLIEKASTHCDQWLSAIFLR